MEQNSNNKMTELCRLCLQKCEEKISIFNYTELDIPKRIHECTQLIITEDDNFPSYICTFCLHQINSWILFRELCHKSYKILLESISNIKNNKMQEEFEDIKDQDWNDKPLKKVCKKQTKVKKAKIKKKLKSCASKKSKITLNKNSNLENEPINLSTISSTNNDTKSDSNETLILHDKQSNIGQTQKIACTTCNKLLLPKAMKKHVVLHTDKYKCSYCGKRFLINAILQEHIKCIHLQVFSCTCELCGKSFRSKPLLKSHLKSHSDTRDYRCKLCSYAARTNAALYTHMFTHEKGSHTCDLCNKVYRSNQHLFNHKRKYHDSEKKLECSVCGKKFSDNYKYETHLRTHTGYRPHKCQFCDKAFVRSDGLRDHMRIHQERKTYSCPKCQKTFIHHRTLGRHNCSK